MINLMRKNQRGMMIFISALVIVSFIWLYNRTDLDKLGKSKLATIYGTPVSVTDFERTERQLRVAYSLGLYELVQTMAGRSAGAGEEEYVWNTLVLRHSAKELQIQPGTPAVTERIQKLPAFLTNDQFDLQKYEKFVTETLTPQGYTTAQLDELVRDDLRLARLKSLLGSSSVVAAEEVKEAFGEAFRKRHVSFIKLKREDFVKNSVVQPEEIQAQYEKSKATFKTEEKRVVKYVAFLLNEKDKALQGKERVAALQPLSTAAEEFSRAMLERGAKIEDVAAKAKVEIKVSAPFTQTSPPVDVASVSNFAETAFSLTPETPDSDVLQTDAGFYILHLDRADASQQKTLEQATAEISKTLQDEKVQQAMSARAKELAADLQTRIKTGKTFAQAATEAGLQAEELPPFSPAEPGEASQNQAIQMGAATLEAGALSDLIETPEGGSIAYLQAIDPLDESLWEGRKKDIMPRYESSKRELNFAEWFRTQRQQANLQMLRQG